MRLHREPILILGMQRSGSSALAGALAASGLSFGRPELLYGADANNPTGYFEHRKATLLNLRTLETFGMHPTSFSRLPDHWAEHPRAESLIAELREFITVEFDGQGRWGIKQPVTTLVLPLYLRTFADLGLRPRFVVCVRNPLEVMESESRLAFGGAYRVMPKLGPRALGSWLRYTLGPFGEIAEEPIHVVHYDRLLKDPSSELKRISAFASWREADVEAGAAKIEGRLRHNEAPEDALDRYPDLIRRTRRVLDQYVGSPEASRDRLVEFLAEYRSWVSLMEDRPPLLGKLGLGWTSDGRPMVAEVTYRPKSAWRWVSLVVDAPPATAVQGILFAPPARIWIRTCRWKCGEYEQPAEIRPGICTSLAREGNFLRLETVYEPGQITIVTPRRPGPYCLELEIWVDHGAAVSQDIATQLGRRLGELSASSAS